MLRVFETYVLQCVCFRHRALENSYKRRWYIQSRLICASWALVLAPVYSVKYALTTLGVEIGSARQKRLELCSIGNAFVVSGTG